MSISNESQCTRETIQTTHRSSLHSLTPRMYPQKYIWVLTEEQLQQPVSPTHNPTIHCWREILTEAVPGNIKRLILS